MPRGIAKHAPAYRVEIFIGGSLFRAEQVCQAFCDEVGLCVTLEPTKYIFTGGAEDGVRVGLINYARFPKTEDEIWDTATLLANQLLEHLGQGSYTIQDPENSFFYSEREVDLAAQKN